MRNVPMIWAVLVLSGCGAGPVFTPPTINLPDRYSLIAPVSAPKDEDVQWWLHFNDPILTHLVEQGLTGNLDLAEAEARLREAEALARRDGVLLSGDGNLSVTGVSGDSDQSNAGVTAKIGLAGERRWSAKAAGQRLESAQFNRVEAQRQILAEISIAYMDLRFFQRSRENSLKDLRSRQRTEHDLQTLLDAGEATQLDLVRARSLVVETQAAIPRLEAEIVRQRNRISTLLGVPVGTLNVDLGYRGSQPDAKLIAAPGVPADLLRARPDIRRAERLYAAAVSDVGAAEAARYPSLSLSGLITAPLSGGSNSETLVAGLSVPLFDQPGLIASADAAKARVQLSYLQWYRAVLSAVEEVENAQAALQASIETTRRTSKLVSLNRESLDLSRDLLKNRGAITVLDVLDRERSLSEAQNQLARTIRNQAVEYITLRVALGQGHDLAKDQD